MLKIRIVLVEPENEGNIGSIARLMKNFEFDELWLVNPQVRISTAAHALASHAQDILANITIVDKLEKALEDVSYVVGTTSILAKSSSNIVRTTITPREFAMTAYSINGKIAILLGRESKGLSNKELKKCDIILTIPSSPIYRTLNIASSSAIICYELWQTGQVNKRGYVEEADKERRARLFIFFAALCRSLKLPTYKDELTIKAFQNIINRAFISKREATLIIGVLRNSKGFWKMKNK